MPVVEGYTAKAFLGKLKDNIRSDQEPTGMSGLSLGGGDSLQNQCLGPRGPNLASGSKRGLGAPSPLDSSSLLSL